MISMLSDMAGPSFPVGVNVATDWLLYYGNQPVASRACVSEAKSVAAGAWPGTVTRAAERGAPVPHPVDQLGWRDHLEVGADHAQPHDRPFQLVGGHPNPAAAHADLIDRCPPADPLAHQLGGRLDDDLDVISGPGALDAGPDKGGGVGRGQLARAEPGSGPVRPGQAVQPVAPPALPVQVVADQVPAAAEQDEAMRFYVTAGVLAAGRGVREPDPFGIAAGEGQGGEDLRVYGL